MTVLYVFPHPDDESFGPGPAIARQAREGHAVHVLTLTKGGATTVRHGLGLSVAEMGEVRAGEAARAVEALGASLRLLDFPDGGLAGLDPRALERAVEDEIARVRPDVVVTYAHHGNSGHPDHLVAHAVVKRAFVEARERAGGPRRLALFTLVEGEIHENPVGLRGVPRDDLGAVVPFSDADRAAAERALACYETYAEVVEAHRPLRQVERGVAFVLFGEGHGALLRSLTEGLEAAPVGGLAGLGLRDDAR